MTSVQMVTPIDTTGVTDNGVRALITLARSLGWNIVLKPGQPCTIIAKDGARLRMPTDTTIRDSVFQGYLSTLMTHSIEHTPTVELMDSVIAIHKKLDDSRKNRLRLAVGETAAQHRERMKAAEQGAREYVVNAEPITQTIKLPDIHPQDELLAIPTPVEATTAPPPTQPLGEPETPRLVKSGPYMKAARKGHRAQPSENIIQQEWSDGSVTYKCAFCPFTSANIHAHSGHNKNHGAKSREGLWRQRKAQEAKEVIVPEIKMPEPDEPLSDAEKLDAIQTILGGDALKLLQEENEQLIKENVRLGTENIKLTNDWAALKSLLGGSS